MKPSTIIKQTLKNGGFTPESVQGRYIVATPSNEKAVSLKHFTKSLVSAYTRLAHQQGLAIGTWVHKGKGKVYLDTVKGFEDLEEALIFAKRSNQLAIYDREAGQEIFL